MTPAPPPLPPPPATPPVPPLLPPLTPAAPPVAVPAAPLPPSIPAAPPAAAPPPAPPPPPDRPVAASVPPEPACVPPLPEVAPVPPEESAPLSFVLPPQATVINTVNAKCHRVIPIPPSKVSGSIARSGRRGGQRRWLSCSVSNTDFHHPEADFGGLRAGFTRRSVKQLAK